MAGIQELSMGRKDLFMVDPSKLQEEPKWNVRISGTDLDEYIRELADSIKEIGVKEPLTVYMKEGIPIVTNGHCRLMAIALCRAEGVDIKSVPVRVEDKGTSPSERVLSMIVRNSGRPLSALELAEVIKRLQGHGWPMEDIAKRTGKTTHHLNNLLTLSAAPDTILNLVKSGQVSPSLAMKMIQEKGEGEAAKVLTGAVETAKVAGKKKATAKDLKKVANLKIPWKEWGPKLREALSRLCSVSEHNPNFGDYLSAANEVVSEMEAQFGPIPRDEEPPEKGEGEKGKEDGW